MALTLVVFVPGTKIKSNEVNSNFAAINAELFDISDANIAAGANIADTKLAQIASTNKVNGSSVVAESIDAVKGQFFWGISGLVLVGTNVSFVYEASANLTPIGVSLRIKTAPTGAALIVDINKNGTTIFSTRPQINDGATSGGGSAVFSGSPTFADGDYLTVDVDQVGSTYNGQDLSVILKCEQKVPQ